jgi:hypothetical protein
MPRYFFSIHNGNGGLSDHEGTELADLAAARDYAGALARELMHRNEARVRHCWVVVRDDRQAEVFSLPFLSVDASIDHLNPYSRRLIAEMCVKRLALAQAVFDCRLNVFRVRATLARARARPYLATTHGHRIQDEAG